MARIHSVKINNFRGIKSFYKVFYGEKIICLVGRGDSGKTTILEAISCALSNKWGLSFYDTDFFNSEVENPIKIEITLTNIPEQLLSEFKFGLHFRMINPDNGDIIDDVEEGEDHWEKALTIKLVIDKSLEPEWFVINDRQDPKHISSKDRSLLGIFLIADSTDSHFSWNQGNPLYSLLRKKTKGIDLEGKTLITQAVRDAKSSIDEHGFGLFDEAIDDIKQATSDLGLDIGEVTTAMDFKKIFIGHNSVSLHENNKIPFRLKGKGSKRLISLGIQKILASNDGVVLIDEIEQGLEPDRVKSLIRALGSEKVGQIFLSTHSQNVIEELEANHIHIVTNNEGSTICSNNDSERVQKLYRACPEAVYAKKVIVCEGKTEIGICRAMDQYKIQSGQDNFAKLGVVYSLGEGNDLINKANTIKSLGLDTSLFCDSDIEAINKKKTDLSSQDILVIDWNDGNKTETQIFKDLPWQAVKKLVNYRENERDSESVRNQILQQVSSWSGNLDDLNTASGRESLAQASTNKNNPWFKSIRDGEELGNIIFNYFTQIEDNTRLKQQLKKLIDWTNKDEQ